MRAMRNEDVGDESDEDVDDGGEPSSLTWIISFDFQGSVDL